MAQKQNEDRELVKLSQGGDKEAYRQLVEKYQSRAFSIAYDIVRVREDAEDIVQEAFVKAYLSLSKFQGKSAFYTWFYRIVYNMCIDFKRKVKRRGEVNGPAGELELNTSEPDTSYTGERSESPQELVETRDQLRLLNSALLLISDEHRAVMMLREVDGMSYDRIAEITGVSKGTVMSRLHYARKSLQKAMQEMNPSEL